MKRAGWAACGLAIASLLAGCSGFWDKPSSGGGGSSNASGVFYVLNQKTSKIAAFSFAANSTTPTEISGSPYALAAAPLAAAISPNSSFLYVGTAGGVFVYSIGSGGGLTLLNNSQAIDTNDLPSNMAVDSSGSWLLVNTTGTTALNAIPILSTTGLVDSTRATQTTTLSGSSVQQIAVTPSGAGTAYVFAAVGTAGTNVIPFTSSSTNPFGAVTSYKVKNSGGADNAIAVDPGAHLLYVGETSAVTGTQTGGLRVYTIGASSKLTEVSGSPYPTAGTGPSVILATNSFVYVANRAVSGSSNGNITGYPVNVSGTTYSLGTLINTVSAGSATVGIAEENTSTYVIAANSGGSPDLNTYTFDSATSGKLVAGKTVTGTDTTGAIAVLAVP